MNKNNNIQINQNNHIQINQKFKKKIKLIKKN